MEVVFVVKVARAIAKIAVVNNIFGEAIMWKKGPLPKDTYYWGGIVTRDMVGQTQGFYLCGFNGDHAVLVHNGQSVPASDIVLYNNSIELPPRVEFEIKIKE